MIRYRYIGAETADVPPFNDVFSTAWAPGATASLVRDQWTGQLAVKLVLHLNPEDRSGPRHERLDPVQSLSEARVLIENWQKIHMAWDTFKSSLPAASKQPA